MIKKIYYGLLIAGILTFSGLFNQISFASTQDFVIDRFRAEYILGRDDDGRSTLRTIEYITAIFPEIDQNHGIERAIPTSYDGHSTSLEILNVQTLDGKKYNYSTYDSNGSKVLRIGDSDKYVHGAVTYVIDYKQRDVTKYFSDTDDDEFYWDVNGTDWSQSMASVEVSLFIDEALRESLNDEIACYYGPAGSTDQCDIQNNNGLITSSQSHLNAGETVTIAVGFKPKTFAVYQKSAQELLWEKIIAAYIVYCFIGAVVIVILTIRMIVLKSKRGKGVPSRGTIIPEYLPPTGVDVVLSSVISRISTTWVAAAYVDLAVKHNLKIIERKEGLFNRSVYSMQLISMDGLSDSERAIIVALFGENPLPGAEYKINPGKYDYALAVKLQKITKDSKLVAKSNDYYLEDKDLKSKMKKICIIVTLITFSGLFGIALFSFGMPFMIICFILMALTEPLTQKGRDLDDYLKGLKLYIKVAEAERIKVLQSPSGAEKTPIDTNDSALMVHLYERVLPYAVLFGQEKEWIKYLGKFYEQQGSEPNWYAGTSAFNAISFASAMHSFSSNVYSSSTSSSSGGSGGGGSSGGGGGGGGGGGW